MNVPNRSNILHSVRLIQKCIIVREDGKILALKRNTNDHSRGGCWDLPGGGYEKGEDVIEAIKREVREEVGLSIKDIAPILFANNSDTTGLFTGDNVFALCYVSRNCTEEINLSGEHEEYRWVRPAEFMHFDFGVDRGFFVASMRAYSATLSH